MNEGKKNVMNEAKMSGTAVGNGLSDASGGDFGGSSAGVGYEGGNGKKPLKTTGNGLSGQNGDLAGVNSAGLQDAQGVTARVQGGQGAMADATGVRSEQASAINTQAVKQKSHKKLAIGIAIAVVLLVIGGVVTWMLLSGREEDVISNVPDEPDDVAVVTPNPENPDVSGEELVELSLDDELVQRLYGNFDGVRNDGNTFYSAAQGLKSSWHYGIAAPGEGSDFELAKIGVALTKLERKECLSADGGGLCYSGQEVRDKLEEIFGESFEFYPVKIVDDGADQNIVLSRYGFFAYNEIFDEFYSLPSGTESNSTLGGLYRAERDNDRIYLYEVRGIAFCKPSPAFDEETQEWVGYSECTLASMDGSGYAGYKWNTKDGELTDEDVIARNAEFPRYKWTFVKNGDGNYVFEKLEKVEG